MIDEKKLIEAIVNNPTKDCDKFSSWVFQNGYLNGSATRQNEIIDIINAQPQADKWILFEQREADEEEKEYWLENYGIEIEYMLCGKLPNEYEEIIVSYSNGCVSEDIFLHDGMECYLDSGSELVTEAIAWMPKPQPYKKEGAD